jgi:murein tripeptide amidase MpaA
MSADHPTTPAAAPGAPAPTAATAARKLQISAGFDSGNIEVIAADDPSDIRLAIRPDGRSPHYQWFHFRLSGAKGRDVTLKLTNAGGAAYTSGFKNYRAVASSDLVTWRRVPTEFDGTVMTIRDTPQADAVRYAYFAPYEQERHAALMARLQLQPRVTLETLGQTPDGQDLDLLRIGEPGEGKRILWMIARQHPGESMASWWMEGAIDKLLAPGPVLDQAVVYLVPCMNPDGARRGHLRTNAYGIDLNRAWAAPDPQKSPEVFLVRQRMQATGMDFCLDVHGDEGLPHNFVAGFEGIPSITERQLGLLTGYTTALAQRTRDFQTAKGYPKSAPGKANLAMCTNWTAETFGCLSMTLEMPFKDASDNPDPEFGWSPPRCKELAVACIDVLQGMVGRLR